MSELAEGARLEIVCAAKSGTEGSNPSLSANLHFLDFGWNSGQVLPRPYGARHYILRVISKDF